MDTKKLIEEVLLDLGNNKTLTEVSSKIQIIVRLLGDEELKTWFDCEFADGYIGKELPKYRISQAAGIIADYIVPRGFGAFIKVSGQSIPVANLGMERYEKIMTINFTDPISSVIEYSKHPEDVVMSLNPIEMVWVQRVLGHVQIQNAHKVLSPSTFQTIIESVKSRIIDLFIDLNNTVFNGMIDLQSPVTKGEIHNVVNNYITAGIVQSGSGVIEASNSTIGANISSSISDDIKKELFSLSERIEDVAKDADEEFDEIAESIATIQEELSSVTPRTLLVKNAFKAIAWMASESSKVTIEQLVKQALGLLE